MNKSVIKDRDLEANLRGAFMEAKESLEGKRSLNTLDELIKELRKQEYIICKHF